MMGAENALTSDDRVGSSLWWFTTDPDVAMQTFLEEAVAPVVANFPDVRISRVMRVGSASGRAGSALAPGRDNRRRRERPWGFTGMLLGSTSGDALERASCTVIVVP